LLLVTLLQRLLHVPPALQTLQARQQQHEAAVAQLRQAHEAASSRLAAAGATQEQQQQQLSRLGADNKALQQQVAKVCEEGGGVSCISDGWLAVPGNHC
jgi:predicted  nucleic acid-binding Zn-ribbon protein